jgi:hypothetical protein
MLRWCFALGMLRALALALCVLYFLGHCASACAHACYVAKHKSALRPLLIDRFIGAQNIGYRVMRVYLFERIASDPERM